MMKITNKQQEAKKLRVETRGDARSEAPRNTMTGNEHFDGMLDNKRFDITEEKIDWRID